jgi:hypothetical protein
VPGQYVILSKRTANNNGMVPIGSRDQIVGDLSLFNTAPEREGDDVLYGPGIRLELPPGQDTINQILLTITEEEIAWLVITRLTKAFDWKLVDTTSGRELNAN